MSNTQTELDQAKKDQRLQAETSSLEIERLEAKLVGESKPKLRHGDVYTDGTWNVVIISDDARWIFSYDGGDRAHLSEKDVLRRIKNCGYSFTGINIFDDLKAMQEDVTEFGIEDAICGCGTTELEFKLRDDGVVIVHMNNKVGFIKGESLGELSRFSAVMEATLKRRQS